MKNQNQEIVMKQKILLQTKKQLKKEFAGIDSVIDQVIDLCSSWYLLPQLQERPVIINLWGLTGVGKSSLVNRLAELIDFNEKHYRFDLGEKGSYWGIKDKLTDLFENNNGYPIIMSFDEFQHAKSIDNFGVEIDKISDRLIWELLDTGKFSSIIQSQSTDEIYNLSLKLKYALLNRVKVTNGVVSFGRKHFLEIMNIKDVVIFEEKIIPKKTIYFVPEEYHLFIFEIAKEKFKTPFAVKQQLNKLNGEQTLKFINDLLFFSRSPKDFDFSKAVIFVLGNLDEAYTMSSSYNPDMDADEFHQQSLKINISNIKQTLRLRFRNEQIARLGNNHIIYPAFNRKTFERIIILELDKISEKIKRDYQIELKIEDSLLDLIYNEGVYPTQGTRPVFSTIYQMVGSKVGKMISQLYLNNIKADSIVMKVENEIIKITYYNKAKKVFSFSEIPTLNLSKLRKNKKDDEQAIVAVHECGHALISIFLLNTIPEVIYSKTADANAAGFIYTDFKWKYISKKEILSRIGYYLGGIIAEKIIFGEENITTGSESDIEKATNFTTRMLKDSGMGKLPASYQVEDNITNNNLFDMDNKVNEHVKSLIEQAEKLAFQTLKKQELLLIQMADFLSDNRMLRKDRIKDYLIEYARDYNIEDIIENGDHLFYRSHLKQKVSTLKSHDKALTIGNGFSLNKESLK